MEPLPLTASRATPGGRRGSVVLRARAGSEVEGLSAPLRCWAPSLLCLCSTRWCRRLSRRCSAASRRADARGCRSAGWQSAPGKKGAIRRDFSGCLPTAGAYRDFRNGASGLPCPLAAWCAAAMTCPLLVSRVRSLAANLLCLHPCARQRAAADLLEAGHVRSCDACSTA